MLKEQRRCTIEERMSRKLRLAHKPNELQIHQRLDIRRYIHSANFLNLALGDWLTISHDSKRLKRSAPKPTRAIKLQHRADITPAARRRLKAIRSASADKLKTASSHIKRLAKPLKSLVNLARSASAVDIHNLRILASCRLNSLDRFANLCRRKRRLARKKKRSHNLLQTARQRYAHIITHNHQAFPKVCRRSAPWTEES